MSKYDTSVCDYASMYVCLGVFVHVWVCKGGHCCIYSNVTINVYVGLCGSVCVKNYLYSPIKKSDDQLVELREPVPVIPCTSLLG